MFNLLIHIIVFFIWLNPVVPVQDEPAKIPFTLETLVELPDEVEETSGVILFAGLIWTFNDSGGDTVLFGISAGKGTIEKKIILSNCKNKDWEALTQNSKYIFIGDIGNNDGSRTDLTIYFIEKRKITNESEQIIIPEEITFKYEDQNDFTPARFASSFDCEAMISTDDSIFLFTKDWVNLKTTIYEIPARSGNYVAKRVSEIDVEGLITDASLKNDTLVLCGYNLFNPFVLIFKNFMVLSDQVRIELENSSGVQMEGIAIMNKNKFILTNEKSSIAQSAHLLKVDD